MEQVFQSKSISFPIERQSTYVRTVKIGVSQPFLIRGTLPSIKNNLAAPLTTIYQ